MDHEYLFKILSAVGFGQLFISYVCVMYSSTESLVKVGGSLTPPFLFKNGIRQGCPLSGLLCSIAIEPSLHTFHNRVKVVSGHKADDIIIVITRDRDFGIVEGALKMYSQASAACLNLTISKGIWAWFGVSRRDYPLSIGWNHEGFVFVLFVWVTPPLQPAKWAKVPPKDRQISVELETSVLQCPLRAGHSS